jgi:hypothetical protein
MKRPHLFEIEDQPWLPDGLLNPDPKIEGFRVL